MNSILIVVDMQNDFIDGALGTKEAVGILPKVIEKIENYNGEVIFTRDTHGENYMDTQEGIKLPVIHCIKGSYGWQLNKNMEKIAHKNESKIFDKGIFGSVDMANYVKKLWEENKIQVAELVGVCTDICVISNAILLKSMIPELTIKVYKDCCAGVTPESHNNALRAMNMCQIEVI